MNPGKSKAALTDAFNFINAQMDDCADVKLKSAQQQKTNIKAPRFILSYAANDCNVGGFKNIAHIYDQSLALLAYLACGRSEDLMRAAVLADALVIAQNNDRTFKDGRLRNAYACGNVIDSQSGTTRMPGRWNIDTQKFEEDEYALGSDTGNMAWAAIALVQAQQLLPNPPKEKYLKAAIRLANWIVTHTVAKDTWGGFYGGLAGGEQNAGDPNGQAHLTWRSTEHNIDLMALFELLEIACGSESSLKKHWSIQKNQAMKFINTMWEHRLEGSFLLTGSIPSKQEPNRDFIPLDPQTWSVLAFNNSDESNPYIKALDWAVTHCKANITYGYDFNCGDGDGAWWEGTAQMALALKTVKKTKLYDNIMTRLRAAQIRSGASKGAMPAASKCGLTTGIYKLWISTQENLPLLYPNSPHVGATAWYIFALLGKNPFFLENGKN
ncbi:MAG: hypothetical protein PVI90_10960 [Desulfobacteraceae bacterium]